MSDSSTVLLSKLLCQSSISPPEVRSALQNYHKALKALTAACVNACSLMSESMPSAHLAQSIIHSDSDDSHGKSAGSLPCVQKSGLFKLSKRVKEVINCYDYMSNNGLVVALVVDDETVTLVFFNEETSAQGNDTFDIAHFFKPSSVRGRDLKVFNGLRLVNLNMAISLAKQVQIRLNAAWYDTPFVHGAVQ